MNALLRTSFRVSTRPLPRRTPTALLSACSRSCFGTLTRPPSRFTPLASRAFSRTAPAWSASQASSPRSPAPPTEPDAEPQTAHENIYTIPNALTVSRILSCPVIGYALLHDQYYLSSALLVYAGLSDWVDGYIARRFNMRSVLGTILDPAADKALMTTLTVTLAMKGLLPVPLAVIILGRDVALSLSAFYIRYKTLPSPKSFSRYWDFSIPSAEVRPTQISKYNTALQLLLMLVTAVSPIVPHDFSTGLVGLQWIVATTTIWSGLTYVFTKGAVRVVARNPKIGPSPPAS